MSTLPDGWYWVKFGYLPEEPPEVLMKRDGEWWAVGQEFPYPEGLEERQKVLAGPLEVPSVEL